MLYSLKMRSAQGGPHERGGRHISGEERIVEETAIEACVHEMLERAKTHQRGEADFVNIKVNAFRLRRKRAAGSLWRNCRLPE